MGAIKWSPGCSSRPYPRQHHRRIRDSNKVKASCTREDTKAANPRQLDDFNHVQTDHIPSGHIETADWPTVIQGTAIALLDLDLPHHDLIRWENLLDPVTLERHPAQKVTLPSQTMDGSSSKTREQQVITAGTDAACR